MPKDKNRLRRSISVRGGVPHTQPRPSTPPQLTSDAAARAGAGAAAASTSDLELSRDALKVSGISKRTTGKWASNTGKEISGGVVYEKAKSRRVRHRAALKHSGNPDDAIPLGTTGKREGSKRGPGMAADMPSEVRGGRRVSEVDEAEQVGSLMRAGLKMAKEAERQSIKRDKAIKRRRVSNSAAASSSPRTGRSHRG